MDRGSPATWDDPGDPGGCGCNLGDETDDPVLRHWFDEEIEEWSPDFCGYFQERKTGFCSCCGKFIKTNVTEHPTEFRDPNGHPLCSKGCLDKTIEAWDAELEAEKTLFGGFP